MEIAKAFMLAADMEDEDDLDEARLITSIGLADRATPRKMWVHPLLQKRKELGVFTCLVGELNEHEERFISYFRMTRDQFQMILNYIRDSISKQNTHYRESISAEERLALCLSYLATGESYRSLGFAYRISHSTIVEIVPEVCRAIWTTMSGEYVKFPQSEAEWEKVAKQFNETWDFPNCCGALDGKHIAMKAPPKSGTLFHNYKGTFSIVLLAVVDANYQFIMVDVGAYGANNDSGILERSIFGQGLQAERFALPPDRPLSDAGEEGDVPFVFIADEGLPLTNRLMRPYGSRGKSLEERVFNYRLSRERRMVESAFGILAGRWRVFQTKIAVRPEVCVAMVKATIVLHNFLQKSSTPTHASMEMNALLEGTATTCEGFMHLQPRRGHRQRKAGEEVRRQLTKYFMEGGQVPWQNEHVARGLFEV